MNNYILHITARTDWYAAQKAGAYIADKLAREGFIHCSKADQVLRVANVVFTGRHGLVVLVIDPARLTAKVRWEPGVDMATELFPHIYGPVDLDAVVDVLDFEPGPDGLFSLLRSLEG